jgi:hypothetical protein
MNTSALASFHAHFTDEATGSAAIVDIYLSPVGDINVIEAPRAGRRDCDPVTIPAAVWRDQSFPCADWRSWHNGAAYCGANPNFLSVANWLAAARRHR